jgi:hypothetical protein
MKAEIRINQESMKAQTETNRHKLQTQFKVVVATAKRRRGTETGVGMENPPNFNGTISWAMNRHQFETVEEHKC